MIFQESHIRIYDDVLSESDCQSIIRMFEESPQKKSAMVDGVNESIRKSTFVDMTGLAEIKPEWKILDDAVSAVITEVWNIYNNELKLYRYVSPKITDRGYEIHRYEPGGFYSLHCDSGSAAIGHRFLSILIYLNDVSGGETSFPAWDVDIECIEGRVAVFPSGFTHIHEGMKPRTTKYIITAFMSH